MTKVINIIAGSGCGKTTTAAGLFYEMKKLGLSVELVQEFVKTWAWQGKEIVREDQPTILDEQHNRETMLYNKVDFIITDSPIILSPVYEKFNYDSELTKDSALVLLEGARAQGVEHIFFLLNRTKPFDPRGRYETAEEASKIDVDIKGFMCDNGIEFYEVSKIEQDDKVNEILEEINYV